MNDIQVFQPMLITGAAGFLGKNLVAHLQARDDVELFCYDRENTEQELHDWVAEADVVFHLAGVNRPERVEEFEEGNAGFTETLTDAILAAGRSPHIIVSSSIQAESDNPYGRSKKHGEDILAAFARKTGAKVSIFRLTNLFGKWSRPNYNAVTSTFCYNIANGIPIEISNPDHEVTLAYVDDVIEAFLKEMEEKPTREGVLVEPNPIPDYTISLGDLADRIRFIANMQNSQQLMDFSDRFNKQLYATYLSYLPKERWEYGPQKIHTDDRGNLAELLKSPQFGQVFVSRTKPGITRGNHYHHTKTEKFIVISGEATIRFRHIDQTDMIEYPVMGEDYRIVDIPPGYTHSITNTGDTELITLFWACEPFDPDNPDTYYLAVDPE